jgi:L-asparaginase
MRKIAVVTTGGTIAMSAGVPSDEAFGARGVEFLAFANEPSPFFSSDFAYKLANYINKISDGYDGVVITHGTDTMQESAIYLDLVLEAKIPVVFTGAIHMRNHSAYDGEANLQNAILCAQKLNGGVFVAFDSDVFAGRFVHKQSAISRRAFASTVGKIASIANSRLIGYFDLPTRKTLLTPAKKGKIAIIKAHYDIDPELISTVFERSSGVVLEGFGAGRVPKAIVSLVQTVQKPLVISGGASEPSTGDEYLYEGGCAWIVANNLPIIFSQADSKKSAIALNLAIQNGLNHQEIQNYFLSEIY